MIAGAAVGGIVQPGLGTLVFLFDDDVWRVPSLVERVVVTLWWTLGMPAGFVAGSGVIAYAVLIIFWSAVGAGLGYLWEQARGPIGR